MKGNFIDSISIPKKYGEGYPNRAAHSAEGMATVLKRQGAAVARHANFGVVRTGDPIRIEGMEVRLGDRLQGDPNGLTPALDCTGPNCGTKDNGIRARLRILPRKKMSGRKKMAMQQ